MPRRKKQSREAAVANQRRYLEYRIVIPFVFRTARRSAGGPAAARRTRTQPATASSRPGKRTVLRRGVA